MSDNSAQHKGFNLSEWALKHQSLVIFMMIVTVLAGFMSYNNLSRNEDPAFTIKTMVVSAAWPGATASETVKLVTDTLEKKLEETPHLDFVQSYSRAGEAVVMVNLRDDTPPSEVAGVWYDVRKKMADLAPSLPQGVQGPFLDDEFGDTFGIVYGFQGEGFSDAELRDRVDTIRGQLLDTPSIGKINLIGVQPEQVVIEFLPGKLAALNLNADQAMASLQAQNAVVPAGTLRTDAEKIGLRVDGAFASEQSLRAVVLRIGDRFVPLADIATISRVPMDPPAPAFRVNGQNAIGLAISMAEGGNLLDFGQAIAAKMDKIKAELPYGIEVVQVADQGIVVDHAIEKFVTVLIEAIAIVLAVSFLSLGTRAGLVVTISIPLVLAMTFFGMEIAGIGLQRISLGALIIALGLLVDDAMITVEAMVSRLEHGWDKGRAATYAYESTAFPMLTGTLVMIAGFVPVGFAASSAGEYCYSLFMVVMIALVSSWIVAVLFSPLLGVWILPKVMKSHDGREGRVTKVYKWVLSGVMRHRLATIAVALGLFTLSILGMMRLEEQYFPSSDRPELLVSLTLPQNASIEATDAHARKLEAILAADPGVEKFSTYIGSGAIRFYLPMDVLLTNDNITETVVVAKSLEERDALRAKLEQAFETDFSDVIARATPLELGPPVGWPLKMRVTGPDVAKVRDIAMDVANLMGQNALVRDINLTAGEPQRSVRVELDQTKARELGITSQDVASIMSTIYTGTPLLSLREGNRLVDVLVRGAVADRQDLAAIANLQIATPSGRSVPLRQIASVENGVEEPIIWRRQREPIITVQADAIAGQKPATVAAQLTQPLEAFNAQLPQGYKVTMGGAVEEAAKGSDSVFAVVPIMLMIMVALLMVQLQSFARTALALFMAPFGLIGVVAAMLPTGTPMGFVAQLGVIALAGMIIRNAVILIQEVDNNVAVGMPPDEAIRAASLHRARPIVLTACAAVLGMIPIASQVFWGPMAYAIIGGLTIATLLTLTVLPACLGFLLDWEARKRSQQVPAQDEAVVAL